MRLSRYYIPTLKEDPSEAEVVSHKLLMRAGMIRKLTSGIYNYLPLGLKSVNKVAAIVREEMNRAGALEVLMPMVQPGDLWQEPDAGITTARNCFALKIVTAVITASDPPTKKSLPTSCAAK